MLTYKWIFRKSWWGSVTALLYRYEAKAWGEQEEAINFQCLIRVAYALNFCSIYPYAEISIYKISSTHLFRNRACHMIQCGKDGLHSLDFFLIYLWSFRYSGVRLLHVMIYKIGVQQWQMAVKTWMQLRSAQSILRCWGTHSHILYYLEFPNSCKSPG